MKDDPVRDPDPDETQLVERLVQAGLPDPGVDPRLDRIRDLQRRLDALAEVESEAADDGREPQNAAAEERVESLVRQRLGRRSRTPGGGLGVPGWMIGLAALLAVGLSLWLVLGRGSRPDEVAPGEPYRLSGSGTGELRWRPSDDGSVEFRWRPSDRAGVSYQVLIHDGDPATGGAVLASSAPLDEARWNPVEDHTSAERPVTEWPKTIWIEVREDSFSGVATVVSEPLTR